MFAFLRVNPIEKPSLNIVGSSHLISKLFISKPEFLIIIGVNF